MTTSTTDTASASKTPKADSTDKSTTRRRRSRTESTEESNRHTRYFLGPTDHDGGTPALDREVASEGEVLVEALRLGVSYYALQEFRVEPDFSGRLPRLRKELVPAR